eukprot:jgi/Botrbrau1/17632/Bobra.0166s0063.1
MKGLNAVIMAYMVPLVALTVTWHVWLSLMQWGDCRLGGGGPFCHAAATALCLSVIRRCKALQFLRDLGTPWGTLTVTWHVWLFLVQWVMVTWDGEVPFSTLLRLPYAFL